MLSPGTMARVRCEDEMRRKKEEPTAAAPKRAARLSDEVFDRGLGLPEKAWSHCGRQQRVLMAMVVLRRRWWEP